MNRRLSHAVDRLDGRRRYPPCTRAVPARAYAGRVTPGQGPRRRFARQLREAALRATPEEALRLEALEAAVRSGAVCVFDAQRSLTALLRSQHARAG